MDREVNDLLVEQERLNKLIRPYQDKIMDISRQIKGIQDNCPHTEIKNITVEGEDYYYSIDECVICKEQWF